MLVAIDQKNNPKIAWNTNKNELPLFCPNCQEMVILKKGKIKIHHFSHKPPVSCEYGKGESQKHYQVKKAIYDELINHPQCSGCELEKSLDGVRPDIIVYIGQYPVAIEVQKSSLDIKDLFRRTKRYYELGIFVLWILPDKHPENTKFIDQKQLYICRPKEWHKYVHSLYFGRLYFWTNGARVRAAHLSPYKFYVKEGNWVEEYAQENSLEETHWYDDNVSYGNYGGYHKTSKTQKVVQWQPNSSDSHIAEDFKPCFKEQWESTNWTTPTSRLWIDKMQKWW